MKALLAVRVPLNLVPGRSPTSADLEYRRIADAIAQLSQDTGKPPLILSLCEWGEVRHIHFRRISADVDLV